MLFTYDGIVVGRRDIGESNCFLDILTDEQGIIEATAHGVKKINSSLLGSCGLFSYSTFCLNKTRLRYSVNSAKPKRSFHELGSDIEKLALASYFAQAVKFCIPEEQAANGSDSIVRFFAISLYEAEMARDPRGSPVSRRRSSCGFPACWGISRTCAAAATAAAASMTRCSSCRTAGS